ncbi:DegV family protein [Fusibacter paucivorans]|uniref:DegV family protein n=1 Tax=Fusibacter paucivorans TaxID=76009 RepID=A0ABS5PU21_9FIRM|nr:DegV family protein [Fusibacter paucivorans]MBS7527856.1 DegV family protein [Fusibacter paucivorans]
MTQLIIDSTCDVNPIYIAEHHIEMLPLSITLGEDSYDDKIDITPEAVYDAMRNGIYPKTAQPTPYKMLSIFETCCKKQQDFIYLSFSSALSGTCQTASLVIEALKEKYPNVKMTCIDSKSGSAATALILESLVKLNPKTSFEVLIQEAQSSISKIQHIFTINDISWLVKGGRINRFEGTIGQILKIKPILNVREGFIEMVGKERGRKRAYAKLLSMMTERIENTASPRIGITHADSLNDALLIESMIKERFRTAELTISSIGSTLASHLGIGGIGLFFFSD